jgi:hypothetical protein
VIRHSNSKLREYASKMFEERLRDFSPNKVAAGQTWPPHNALVASVNHFAGIGAHL